MIKANELRIGNLVNVPREDQSPFRIDAFEYLSHTYIKVAMIHPEFGEKMHPLTWYDEDLKPIPLTEEWLLKLGFNTEYKKGYIGIDHKAGGMITDFVLTYPNVLGVFQEYFIWEHSKYKYTELKYVHELQNLFFCLTGTELTVA